MKYGKVFLRRVELGMANWVKYLKDLPQDPAVILICDKTRMDTDRVCGKLMRLWSWADGATTDGFVPNITPTWIDKFIGKSGFSDAMVSAGWLEFKDGGVVFPNFERHNGNSAKKRAEDAERQRLSRANRYNTGTDVTKMSQESVTDVTQMSHIVCDKSVTRGEEIREEKNKDTPLPPKGGRIRSPKPLPEYTIPPSLNSNGFPDKFAQFVKFRHEKKKYLTVDACLIALRNCEKWGVQRAIQSIDNSIMNGWQGLFEPKDGGYPKPAPAAPTTGVPIVRLVTRYGERE